MDIVNHELDERGRNLIRQAKYSEEIKKKNMSRSKEKKGGFEPVTDPSLTRRLMDLS